MTELPDDGYSLNSSHPYFLIPMRSDPDGKLYLWYSICSRHRSHAPECNLCARGSWIEIQHVKKEDDDG